MKVPFKKVLKISGLLLLVLVIFLIAMFYRFSMPKSNEKLIKNFQEEGVELIIKTNVFKGFKFRVLSTQRQLDTSKVTFVFVHGSIGSANDFKSYLVDNDLRAKVNLIAYDRVGYGIHQTGNVQESIKFETDLLEDLLKNIDAKKVVLIGYSYGGPIALASEKKYKSIVLLAPAVSAEAEPMPWAINFYKWKLTRWILPKTWQAASKEKLSHSLDLMKYDKRWQTQVSEVVSIHGKNDWIVPFENTLYLKDKLKKNQYKIIELNGAGHGLVWSRFDEIKSVLLQQL